MKIGIISSISDYSWSGSEEMWRIMAEEALESGHQVSVVLDASIAASPELSRFRSLGGKLFASKSMGWVKRRLASKGIYSRYGKLEGWKPDLLCISLGTPGDLYWNKDLLALVKKRIAPLVLIVQCNAEGQLKGPDQRRELLPVYHDAHRIICVSESNASLLQRQLALHLENIRVLPNPIRTRMVKPLPWHEEKDGLIKFATVGRYDADCKCQDQTMEALSSPEWKERNWHLSLYGSGPDRDYLRDLITYYGLEGKVSIKGYERDFRTIWAKHHLHILNSRAEGLTLALIESMFCGRPAVVTRAGGNHELIRDGVDGFVCPGLNVEMIRQTLEAAWKHKQEWRRMGGSAFKRASEYVPENLAKILLHQVINSDFRH